MKKIVLILAVVTAFFTGCYKDDNNGVISGESTLTGANVVPSVTTSATAKFSYAYNYNTRTFSYQIDYSGLTDSCTQFGIAKALSGATLPTSTFQLFNFSTPVTLQRRVASTYNNTFVVDGYQITLDELRTGKYCVYLKSKAFPANGEIRAQIVF